MLDVVENIGGRADKANDAEILVVDEMRKIGATALQEWTVQREGAATEKWSKEHAKACYAMQEKNLSLPGKKKHNV